MGLLNIPGPKAIQNKNHTIYKLFLCLFKGFQSFISFNFILKGERNIKQIANQRSHLIFLIREMICNYVILHKYMEL